MSARVAVAVGLILVLGIAVALILVSTWNSPEIDQAREPVPTDHAADRFAPAPRADAAGAGTSEPAEANAGARPHSDDPTPPRRHSGPPSRQPSPEVATDRGISGRVVDSLGMSVDAVFVRAYLDPTAPPVREVCTDEEGNFEILGLPDGTYTLRVCSWADETWEERGRFVELRPSPQGSGGVEINWEVVLAELSGVAAPSSSVLLRVKLSTVLMGRVLDDVTGKPVPHDNPEIDRTSMAPSGFSDPGGRFVVICRGIDTFTLRFKAKGDYLATPRVQYTLRTGEVRRNVIIRLKKGGTLAGRVLHRDGKEVRFALVMAVGHESGDVAGSRPFQEFLKEGKYEIRGVAGVLDLQVVTVDYPDVRIKGVRVRPGEIVQRDVYVQDGGRLNVFVKDALGSPMKGVKITAKHLVTEEATTGQAMFLTKRGYGARMGPLLTDEIGAWSHPALGAGRYEVRVENKLGKTIASGTCSVAAGRATDLDLVANTRSE